MIILWVIYLFDFSKIFSSSSPKQGVPQNLSARLAIARMKQDGVLDRDLALKFIDTYHGEVSEKVIAEVQAAAYNGKPLSNFTRAQIDYLMEHR